MTQVAGYLAVGAIPPVSQPVQILRDGSDRWWKFEFPYVVHVGQDWPRGRVVNVCMALRGARRSARRWAKRQVAEDTSPTLVERVS